MKPHAAMPENEHQESGLSGMLRWMGMSVFVGAVLMGTARRASAAQFTVTNKSDSGAGSLRDAVAQANAAAGPDTIVFATSVAGTIPLTSEIPITDSVTITGPGAANLSLDGGGASRIFNISNGTVEISSLTITNGNSTSVDGVGGGIYNDGNLTLKDCVISNNKSPNSGGGVGGFGNLTVLGCTVTGNACVGPGNSFGGGLYGDGNKLYIANSTITNNTALYGGGVSTAAQYLYLKGSTVSGNSGGKGGGVWDESGGYASIQHSTISGNKATISGGGVYSKAKTNLYSSTVSGNSTDGIGGGLLTGSSLATSVQNSTISGNSAKGSGGGIYHVNNTLNVRNSTITNNSADSDNNATGAGGGLFVNAGTATVTSTILSGNRQTPGTPVADDVTGAVDGTSSFNIVGVLGNMTGMADGINSDQVGTAGTPKDPLLGPLQDNGGPTFTHAIPGNSIAHDAGQNPGNFSFDQRGRTFRRVSAVPDVGAFEFQDPPITYVVKNLNDNGPDSLRDCILQANSHFRVNDIITFEAGLTGTITLTSGSIGISDGLDIQGPGASVITVSGNNASRIFKVNDYGSSVIDVSIEGLTLSDGYISGNGGAIYLNSADNLTITGSVLTNNTSTGSGGALYQNDDNDGGVLTIKNTTFSNNKTDQSHSYGGGGALTAGAVLVMDNCILSGNYSGGKGGALWGEEGDSITITNTIFKNNTAYDEGGGFFVDDLTMNVSNTVFDGNKAKIGGGFFFYNDEAGTFSNCTISNNTATDRGGGIYLYTSSGPVIIENCTISGNTATNSGGGIYIGNDVTTIRNSTITNNTADLNGFRYGGGIYVGQGGNGGALPPGPPNDVLLQSTIVAGNIDRAGLTPDINGPVADVSANNIIGIDTGMTGITNGTNANQVGTINAKVDPKLGPLQANGGTLLPDGSVIQTHALLLGSPALDKGDDPGGLTTDGRGTGFNRIEGGSTDIGAFENQVPIVDLAGPLTLIEPGNPMTFDATATIDPDGDPLTYSWDVNGDGVFGDGNFTGPNPTFTAAQLLALGIGDATESFTVTVKVDDGRHTATASTTLSVTLKLPNPQVNSPVITPNPVDVGEPVTVLIEAQDPTGHPLTYTYDWGDGTINSSNVHTYETPGVYTINVTVSNGSTSTTSQFTLEVLAGRPTLLTKVKGVVHFSAPGTDVAHITTVIPDVAPGFTPAGKTLTLDFGGLIKTFVLDAKGKAKTADGTVSMQYHTKKGVFPGGPIRVLFNLKGDFAASWKDEGIDPAKPTKRDSAFFAIKLTFDGTKWFGISETLLAQSSSGAAFHTAHNIIPKKGP